MRGSQRLIAAAVLIVLAGALGGCSGGMANFDPADMLDWLLAEDAMDAGELRDQIVTFIVAGHETVASALTWAWYLLGVYPEYAEKLAVEADEVFGDRRPRFDDLPRLGWASAVYDETLRLYPPGWLITRKAVADDEVLGHHIPAGSLIVISPFLIHRHPASGPDSELFEPGRFLGEAPPRQSGAYLPFGAGPRLCIGREMARAEGALVLSMAAQRFRLQPTSTRPMEAKPLVMLKPRGGLHMTLHERC